MLIRTVILQRPKLPVRLLATQNNSVPTVTLVPRMQGCPPTTMGFSEMRSVLFMIQSHCVCMDFSMNAGSGPRWG